MISGDLDPSICMIEDCVRLAESWAEVGWDDPEHQLFQPIVMALCRLHGLPSGASLSFYSVDRDG